MKLPKPHQPCQNTDNFIIDDQSFKKNLYLLDKMSASGCVLEESYDDFKILCQPIQLCLVRYVSLNVL